MPEVDSQEKLSFVEASLRSLTRFVSRNPVYTLMFCVAAACAAVGYTRYGLEFKTSRSDLIDPKSEYHQRWTKYIQAFGESTDDLVVVVDMDEGKAPDPELIKQVLNDLGPKVEKETHLFSNVLYKVDPSSLRAKGLQYLTPEQLDGILEHLERMGPVLKGKWHLLSLRQFIRGLKSEYGKLEGQPPEVATLADPLFQQTSLLADSLNKFSGKSHTYTSPWSEIVPLSGAQREESAQVHYVLNDKGDMGLLNAQPVDITQDFSGDSPAIKRMRELVAETQAKFQNQGVRIGLTGIPVLESDEMRDSQSAMTQASLLSFAGVAALLLLGFRGFRHPMLTIGSLGIAMAWTFGFTTAAIGHLNILSVSFATMLVGLGDVGTVYLMRYRELRSEGRSLPAALAGTAQTVGPGIVTSSMTTAAAFFVAVFTEFSGVRELGIIAGAGILFCALSAFLTLPAALSIIDRSAVAPKQRESFEGHALKSLTSRYPIITVAICLAGLFYIGMQGFRVKYDYNLLHLQAQGLESVEVQNRIFEKSDGSLLYAVSLANSPEEALALKKKFEALPTVHHVTEVASKLPMIPSSETKVRIQSIQAMLSALPVDVPPAGLIEPKPIGDDLTEIETQLAALNTPSAIAARESLGKFLDSLGNHPEKQAQLLKDYQHRMSADLLAQMKTLRDAANAEPVTAGDLPKAIAARFVSPKGKWLLQVYPKSQIWDIEPLSRFTADIRGVDPDVTGTPLQTFEASKEIKTSYEKVGLYALGVVLLTLLFDFRNIRDALLALLPAAAGAALMFGILGLLRVDLNPANLIILPLVIGIGVDGGVHIVHDFRSQDRHYQPSSSTFSAILLNSATTMIGFGSMMIASHRGLYSLGLVLTVGVGSCLVMSLILLPAILNICSRWTTSPAVAPTIRLLPAPTADVGSDDAVETISVPVVQKYPVSQAASTRDTAKRVRFG